MPSKKSDEIYNAFSRYVKSGDKSLIEKFTLEEIKFTLLQYHLDKGYPPYLAMEQRALDLGVIMRNKEPEDKVNKAVSWARKNPLFALFIIIGIVIVSFGTVINKFDNIITFFKKYGPINQQKTNEEKVQKLKNITIVIHYDIDRNNDVNKIRKSLLELGARVVIKSLPDGSYRQHKGRLYYDFEGGATALEVACLVKSLIADIESVEVIAETVHFIFYNPYELNLWILSK